VYVLCFLRSFYAYMTDSSFCFVICKASCIRKIWRPRIDGVEGGWSSFWVAAVPGIRNTRHLVITTFSEAQILVAGTNMFIALAWQIKLGAVEQNEAQSEFVLRPYINTAKKQKTVGAWTDLKESVDDLHCSIAFFNWSFWFITIYRVVVTLLHRLG
jgi:hypothetical protein